MKHLSLLLCCSFYGLSSISVGAINHERPNILWLTFEDTSAREFGCYGNKDVHTPNIDSLALRGIQFMNAWSVAPQSSAARSSLSLDVMLPHMGWMFIRYLMILP